jgi:hypothetical protein
MPVIEKETKNARLDVRSTGTEIKVLKFERKDDSTWHYQIETHLDKPNETYEAHVGLIDESTDAPLGKGITLLVRSHP